MQKVVFQSVSELVDEMVSQLIELSHNTVTERGLFTMALTGGSAARQLYPHLPVRDIPWKQVHLFFGDERLVPPSHPDSNYRLAKELVIDRVGIPPENVHRIPTESDDPETLELLYATKLIRLLGRKPVLDLVHLGMGVDGHVCSLFPGHPTFYEKVKSVVFVGDSPKPPPSRVSLSMASLLRARDVWIQVTGPDKAEILRECLENPQCGLPAAVLAQLHESVTFVLDQDAAHLLSDV